MHFAQIFITCWTFRFSRKSVVIKSLVTKSLVNGLAVGLGLASSSLALVAAARAAEGPRAAAIRAQSAAGFPIAEFSALKLERGLALKCFNAPGTPVAVGVDQKFEIRAPWEVVSTVVSDFDRYAEIFPDFDDIHVEKDASGSVPAGDKRLTYWEQRIPVPFVSNVKYWMEYQMTTAAGKSAAQRFDYHLTKSTVMKYSDGMIWIVPSPNDPQRTWYWELDFWDADAGILSKVSPLRVLHESLEGLALSDTGIRLRAENREMSGKDVQKRARKELDHAVIEACLAARTEIGSVPVGSLITSPPPLGESKPQTPAASQTVARDRHPGS